MSSHKTRSVDVLKWMGYPVPSSRCTQIVAMNARSLASVLLEISPENKLVQIAKLGSFLAAKERHGVSCGEFEAWHWWTLEPNAMHERDMQQRTSPSLRLNLQQKESRSSFLFAPHIDGYNDLTGLFVEDS